MRCQIRSPGYLLHHPPSLKATDWFWRRKVKVAHVLNTKPEAQNKAMQSSCNFFSAIPTAAHQSQHLQDRKKQTVENQGILVWCLSDLKCTSWSLKLHTFKNPNHWKLPSILLTALETNIGLTSHEFASKTKFQNDSCSLSLLSKRKTHLKTLSLSDRLFAGWLLISLVSTNIKWNEKVSTQQTKKLH